MTPARCGQVLEWMTDAYLDGVDRWGGNLSVAPHPKPPMSLGMPLGSFHALGQTVRICSTLLERLKDVSTLGRAQWWLVIASGIAWNENECPFVPAWTPDIGGGGVYVLGADTSIYDHGYLPENLEAVRRIVTYESIQNLLGKSELLFDDSMLYEWCRECQSKLAADPSRARTRMARFLDHLSQPNLGGVRMNPLEG